MRPLYMLQLFRHRIDRERIRGAMPYVLLITYGAAGSIIIHIAETTGALVYDHRTEGPGKCIGLQNSFAAAIYYIISVCTTIGFGVLYPCTMFGRFFSIVLALFGIPLILTVLADLGDKFAVVIKSIYNFYRRIITLFQKRKPRAPPTEPEGVITPSIFLSGDNCSEISFVDTLSIEEAPVRKNVANGSVFLEVPIQIADMEDLAPSVNQTGSENNLKYEQNVEVPITIGVIGILLCMLTCGVYYYFAEDYAGWESVYFTFVTFLAGDLAPTDFVLAVPMYLVVFAGFSMLSTTIAIIQNNIDCVINKAKEEIRQKVEEAIQKGEEVDTEEVVKEVMSHFGGVAKSVMPTKNMDNLNSFCGKTVEVAEAKQNLEDTIDSYHQQVADLQQQMRDIDAGENCMTSVGVQTEKAKTREKETTTEKEKRDGETQCEVEEKIPQQPQPEVSTEPIVKPTLRNPPKTEALDPPRRKKGPKSPLLDM